MTRLGWSVEGKLAWRSLHDGTTERWAYDGEGNLVEYVDAVGHITRTEIGRFDLPAAQPGRTARGWRSSTTLSCA